MLSIRKDRVIIYRPFDISSGIDLFLIESRAKGGKETEIVGESLHECP